MKGEVAKELKKYAVATWKLFQDTLSDEKGRLFLGIVITMFGVVALNPLLSGFGLGVIFASAVSLCWRDRLERNRT